MGMPRTASVSLALNWQTSACASETLALRERFEFGQKRLEAALDRPGVEADRQHPAAKIDAAPGVSEIARQNGPVDAVGLGGLGDALDGGPDFRMVPIADK